MQVKTWNKIRYSYTGVEWFILIVNASNNLFIHYSIIYRFADLVYQKKAILAAVGKKDVHMSECKKTVE